MKRLYRSRKDRMIAGVCGGLGEYFQVDPTLIRVAFAALTLFNGAGLILYIILAIVIPNSPEELEEPPKKIVEQESTTSQKSAETVSSSTSQELKEHQLSTPRSIFGLALILLGFYFLLQQIFPFHIIRWDLIWPIVLVIVGASIIFKR
ncbi:MAG: PspC domain-containing protein [Actinobacteria bacterium]|nr:PspC domain-containing protein [Actinomycetota bacterium]